MICVIADPQHWEHWEQAKAYLEPARARGGFPAVIDPDEELFAVIDPSDGLLACATAWFSVDGNYVEVKLVGGREHRRWIRQLDEELGRLARLAGAERLIAWGRCGWTKVLPRLGWECIGVVDGSTGYQRALT